MGLGRGLRLRPGSPAALTVSVTEAKIRVVASTLCPACAKRVEHQSDYAVVVVQTETADGIRTRLVANDTIVVHACTTPRST